jgi:hypothetical protein
MSPIVLRLRVRPASHGATSALEIHLSDAKALISWENSGFVSVIARRLSRLLTIYVVP